MRFNPKEGAMPFTFTNTSDRQITVDALRLYAEDCRSLAVALEGTDLGPVLADGANQVERLADRIGRAVVESSAWAGDCSPMPGAHRNLH